MHTHPHSPSVMTFTDDFFHRTCPCGTIQLAFGPTLIQMSPDALIAISATLAELAEELRRHKRAAFEERLSATLSELGTSHAQVLRPQFGKRSKS